MENGYSAKVTNGKLVIEIDVSAARLKAAPLSSTGKSKLVYSTRGTIPVPGSDLKIGLNVMAPKG